MRQSPRAQSAAPPPLLRLYPRFPLHYTGGTVVHLYFTGGPVLLYATLEGRRVHTLKDS